MNPLLSFTLPKYRSLALRGLAPFNPALPFWQSSVERARSRGALAPMTLGIARERAGAARPREAHSAPEMGLIGTSVST